MTAKEVVARLDGVRERAPDRWTAKCPAHQDKWPSLSIRELDDGTVLLYDFGGCHALDVVRAIGLEFSDLFPDRHIRRVEHSERPRIPAAERLELIEHEIGVTFSIASDLLTTKVITEENVIRLARAVHRIGSARHA